jgi:hypothetical protein
MTISCDVCDKKFTRPYGLKIHKSKKIACSPNPKKCEYCDKTFSKRNNMLRHLKDESCLKEQEEFYKNKIKSLEETLKQERQLIDDKLKELELKQIVTNNQIINNNNQFNNNNNTQNNTTMNVLTKDYIIQNYTGDPCMKALDNYDDIRAGNMITDPYYDDENIMFVNTVVSQYICGKLTKYIGEIIITFYKNKDNRSAQTLWCSDLARFKFLVRVLPENATENAWITDSSGVIMKNTIIQPLLTYIVKCIDDYRIKYPQAMITNIDKHLKMSEIVTSIRNDSLINNVARYIAPHFTLGKNLTIKNKKA